MFWIFNHSEPNHASTLDAGGFQEVLYKRGVLKSFLRFTDKYKKHSSGGAQLKILQNSQKIGRYSVKRKKTPT